MCLCWKYVKFVTGSHSAVSHIWIPILKNGWWLVAGGGIFNSTVPHDVLLFTMVLHILVAFPSTVWNPSLSVCVRACVCIVNTDIMNQKPGLAWDLYLKMETSHESYSLLGIIANDCYKVWLTLFCLSVCLSDNLCPSKICLCVLVGWVSIALSCISNGNSLCTSTRIDTAHII